MRRKTGISCALATTFALAGPAMAQDLLAYWNFNTNDGDLYFWNADFGTGSMSIEPSFTLVSMGAGSTLNAMPGDPPGDALNLRSNANNGKSIDFLVDMTGYESLLVSFDTIRNAQGFNSNSIWYSTDGLSYSMFAPYAPDTSFGTVSFDLSSVTELNDASEVHIQLRFDGASNNGGMNRIDNFRIGATIVPAPAALALLGLGALARRRRR